MGQGVSTPYVRMLKHSLAVYGATVASSDIEMCLKVVREWNPWFPEEGTLDMECWQRVRQNVDKAMRQGEKIPIRFWSIWSLIFTILRAMEDDRTVEDFPREVTPAIQTLPLEAEEKKEVERDALKFAPSKEPSECGECCESKNKLTEKAESMIEGVCKMFQQIMLRSEEARQHQKRPTAPPMSHRQNLSPRNPFLSAALAEFDNERGDCKEYDEEGIDNPTFAFPIIRPPPVQGVAQAPFYDGMNIEDMMRLKKAVTLYGPQSHYVKELLTAMARHYGNLAPYDWRVLCRALLKEPEYLQWQMWFSELCLNQARQNALSANPRIQVITYPMLAGIEQYADVAAQANTPEEIHDQLMEISLEAWDRIRPTGEHYGSWTKVIQKTHEPYVEFLSRLKLTLERTVVGEEARQQLLKLLAYENANDDCKRALLPVKETGDLNTFMKVCKDITSESRKMQMLAETMATTWHSLQSKQQSNIKCYGCGKIGHLKKNCKEKKAEKNRGPGICPKCKKGKHWARECRTKVDSNYAGKQGNSISGPAPGPRQIKGENQPYSPSPQLPNLAPQWTYQP